MAACAAILSANIFEDDQPKSRGFFKAAKSGGLKELNTEIWNNEAIAQASGYSILDVRECLYDLSMFTSENLSPNRLEKFDIESVR